MHSSSHRMIRCGNCDWNFRIEGNSTRYVLLLHGAFSSGHTWEKIQAGLSKDFTVLVPDLPGHGSSIYYGKKVLDPDCITDELIELRKALKIPHFEFIIGHSAGALIGASYLLIDKQPSKLIGIRDIR